jgi:hypothetical protein
MPKKKPMKGKPVVHEELDGLEIQINEFGQIITNYDIEKINKFLNREVDDKKLRDRNDITEKGEYLNSYREKKYWKGKWEPDEEGNMQFKKSENEDNHENDQIIDDVDKKIEESPDDEIPN